MNIFFSWQSDLNLKNNKNFIEECIKSAIKEINKENKFFVNFDIDKDTSGEPGNPEINTIILNKIDNARIFVCDLSIINTEYYGRKTPNPNVVFELGYAIKSLGWEKIICIVNQDYGTVEDLPFDLKHRRLLSYSLNSKDRKSEKRRIIQAIKSNINILKDRGLLYDELEDYFKRDIDTEFLTIINHVRKIVLERVNQNLLFDTGQILNFTEEDVRISLKDRPILGFHLFKNFKINSKSLKKHIDNIVSVSNFRKEKLIVLVKFKEWLDRYNAFTNERAHNDLFLNKEKSKNYKILASNDHEYPERMILGKLLAEGKIIVADFGDISSKAKVNNALFYTQVNVKHLYAYSRRIYDFLQIANEWLDKTGNEFVVDTYNNFEMK